MSISHAQQRASTLSATSFVQPSLPTVRSRQTSAISTVVATYRTSPLRRVTLSLLQWLHLTDASSSKQLSVKWHMPGTVSAPFRMTSGSDKRRCRVEIATRKGDRPRLGRTSFQVLQAQCYVPSLESFEITLCPSIYLIVAFSTQYVCISCSRIITGFNWYTLPLKLDFRCWKHSNNSWLAFAQHE